jgi:hypothetical protein
VGNLGEVDKPGPLKFMADLGALRRDILIPELYPILNA